jgi:MFS family permease
LSSQFALLKARRFAPFFLTQFLGAFNDNVFKNALVVLLTFKAASWTTLGPGLLANLAAGLFILPFFLFSATAGQLADKYDKARLARLVKGLEIGVISIAGVGFALHSLTWLMVALFLLGSHSSLFGPVKYAILPQHLKQAELIGGNGLVEAGTFAAILTGTLAGGLLAGLEGGTVWITSFSLMVAVLGYISSRFIPPGPAPVPDLKVSLNPLAETWRNIGFARKNKAVFLAIMGISWFWLYGALFLAQFPAYAKAVLGGTETAVTLLLATFTVGIALGSLFCDKLSRHQVEIGLVPLGGLGLTLFGLDFAWGSAALTPGAIPLGILQLLDQGTTWRILLDLLGLGVFGGFYCVPLYAQMQQDSDVNFRARVIAANNIINALFMVVGAGGAALLLANGASIPALFGMAAIANFAVLAALCAAAPVFLVRCGTWLRHLR